MNEFLVKNGEDSWIDITSGDIYEKCGVPYNQAKEGLCEILGKKVLKKEIKDGFQPYLFKAVDTPIKLPKNKISVPFRDINGKKTMWTFDKLDILEVIQGMEEELNDRELCIRVCASRDAIKKLRDRLSDNEIDRIMSKLGGDVNGRKPEVGDITIKRTDHVRPTVSIIENKQIQYQETL